MACRMASFPISNFRVAPNAYNRHIQRRSVAAATAQAAESLESWLTSNGGVVDGVQLQTSQARSRQLVATRDIKAGTCLISVPRRLQLRYDNVQDSRLLHLFEHVPTGSDTGQGAWQFKQALTLLHHQSQGTASPLWPHLRLLPGMPGAPPVPSVGMLLPDEVAQELQYAPLIQDIMNHKYWWSHFYEHKLQPLTGTAESPFGAMNVTKELFGTAVAVVISRCFGLRKAGTHSLAPMIDMADHTLTNSNCEVSSDEQGSMNMHATTSIPKGSPLLLTYGPHSNTQLLLSYGFVLPPINRHDRFLWTFDLDTLTEVILTLCGTDWIQMPVAAWKLQLLEHLGLTQTSVHSQASSEAAQSAAEATSSLAIGGDPPVDGRLLAAVRVLLTRDEDQEVLHGLPLTTLCDWHTPIARQQEISVMRALTCFVTSIYKGFPTTIQQDRAILQALVAGTGNGKPEEQDACQLLCMAVTFRLGLKLSLEAALLAVLKRSKGPAAQYQLVSKEHAQQGHGTEVAVMVKPFSPGAGGMDTDEPQEEDLSNMDSAEGEGNNPVAVQAVQSALTRYGSLMALLDAPVGEPHLGDACVDFVIAVMDQQESCSNDEAWQNVSRLVLGDGPYTILGYALQPLWLTGPPGFAQRATRAQKLYYSDFLQAMYRSNLERTLSIVMQSLHTYASSQAQRLAQAVRALPSQPGYAAAAASAADTSYKLLEHAMRLVLESQPLTLVSNNGLVAKACLPLAGHTHILSVFKYVLDSCHTTQERQQVLTVLFSPVDQPGVDLLGTTLSILETGANWAMVQLAVDLLRDAASKVPDQLVSAFATDRNEPNRLLQLLRVLRRYMERFATPTDPFIAQLQPVQVPPILQVLLAVLHVLVENKPHPAEAPGSCSQVLAAPDNLHEAVLKAMPAYALKSTLTDLLRVLLLEGEEQRNASQGADAHTAHPGFASDMLPAGGFVVQQSCGICTRRTGRLLITVLGILGSLARLSNGIAAPELGEVAVCSDILASVCCNALKLHPLSDPLHTAVAKLVNDLLSYASSATLERLLLDHNLLAGLAALTTEGPLPGANAHTSRPTYIAALSKIVKHLEGSLAGRQPARRLSAPIPAHEPSQDFTRPAGHRQRSPSCPSALEQGFEAHQTNTTDITCSLGGHGAVVVTVDSSEIAGEPRSGSPDKSVAQLPAAAPPTTQADGTPDSTCAEALLDGADPPPLSSVFSDAGQMLTDDTEVDAADQELAGQQQLSQDVRQQTPASTKQPPALLQLALKQQPALSSAAIPAAGRGKGPMVQQQIWAQVIPEPRQVVLWRAVQQYSLAWSQLKAVTANVLAVGVDTRGQWEAGSPEDAAFKRLCESQALEELPNGYASNLDAGDQAILANDDAEKAAAQQQATDEALMLLGAYPTGELMHGIDTRASVWGALEPEDDDDGEDGDGGDDEERMRVECMQDEGWPDERMPDQYQDHFDGYESRDTKSAGDHGSSTPGLQMSQPQSWAWAGLSGRWSQKMTVQVEWPEDDTAQHQAGTEAAETAADARTAVLITVPPDEPVPDAAQDGGSNSVTGYRTGAELRHGSVTLIRRSTKGGAHGDGLSHARRGGSSSGGGAPAAHEWSRENSWGSDVGDSWGSPISQPADDGDDLAMMGEGSTEVNGGNSMAEDNSQQLHDDVAMHGDGGSPDAEQPATAAPTSGNGLDTTSKPALLPPLLVRSHTGGPDNMHTNSSTPAPAPKSKQGKMKNDKVDGVLVVCISSGPGSGGPGGKLQNTTPAGTPNSNGHSSPAGKAHSALISTPPSKGHSPAANSTPGKELVP